jgi:LPS-assembly lipoprotein
MTRLFAVAALALAIAGCGFKPLYGDRSVMNIGTELANIDVGIAGDDGDVGRLIRYDLLDNLSSSGNPPGNPDYRVDLTTRFYEQDVAIQLDAEVTRSNVIVTVSFQLIDTHSGKVVLNSIARSRTSYNRVTSEFANITASQDAQRRTAKAIADDIKIQIAVFLDRKATKEASDAS